MSLSPSKFNELRTRAKALGATDFGYSTVQAKRLYVVYDGKKINFGYKTGSTYVDHQDKDKRQAWRARHSKVLDKEGNQVINKKSSPSFWASRILW